MSVLDPALGDERDTSIDRPRALTDVMGYALDKRCSNCGGKGFVEFLTRYGSGPLDLDKDGDQCTACNGTGFTLTPPGRKLLAFIRRHS